MQTGDAVKDQEKSSPNGYRRRILPEAGYFTPRECPLAWWYRRFWRKNDRLQRPVRSRTSGASLPSRTSEGYEIAPLRQRDCIGLRIEAHVQHPQRAGEALVDKTQKPRRVVHQCIDPTHLRADDRFPTLGLPRGLGPGLRRWGEQGRQGYNDITARIPADKRPFRASALRCN
jgi:hypothetical protein